MINSENWFECILYLPDGHKNLYHMNFSYGQFHQKQGQPVFIFIKKEDRYSVVKTIGDDDYQVVILLSIKIL